MLMIYRFTFGVWWRKELVMKRKANSLNTIYIVVLFVLFTFLANCGSDSTAPADPSSTSEIPDIVFFNTGDPSPVFLFEGRATDNTRVETVFISFNNGAIWHTADIDSLPPNTIRNVEWSYSATFGDIPAAMNTVLIRALDGDANEVISSPIPLEKQSGSAVTNLENMFAGASSGQVIGLSSGVGGAYGNNTTGPSIPIDVTLKIVGSGYGSTVTSGGLNFPAAASTATFIQSSVSSVSIFSVDADLTLKGMRLLGAENAVRIFDSAGPDPQLTVESCVFDGQGAWAVYAEDDDQVVNIRFLDSIVDASQADNSSRGGLFLDNVAYQIEGSEFYYHTDPGGPTDGADQGAAVQVFDGAGEIIDSIFEDNALAIWASGGDAIITSCNISSTVDTTYGINLTGGPGAANISRNTIDGHTGYGLRVGGEMELILRKNAITNNGLSGVLIDSELNNPSLININMGTSTDKGNNLLDDNDHPNGIAGYETQVYVTQATQEGSTWIPANWNYWGYASRTEVDFAGVDNGENGGGRATLAIGNFWAALNSEVGP